MFLHVGNNKNIRLSAVVGIFDMDNATLSAVTRKYLNKKQKDLLKDFEASLSEKNYAKRQSFFDQLKDKLNF